MQRQYTGWLLVDTANAQFQDIRINLVISQSVDTVPHNRPVYDISLRDARSRRRSIATLILAI